MSDINLDFTVSNNSINFTVEPNDITITPTDIQLSISEGTTLLPGGSPTQLQYNDNGALNGIPTATYDGSNLALGSVAYLKITGGTNGYVLQTDGTGNLNWTAMTGGGGNGTPGGSNTQIQYNNNGTFGGFAGFTFDQTTGNVSIPGNLILGGNFSGSTSNANYSNFSGTAFSVSGSNVSGQVAYAAVANNVAGANVTGTVANATFATTAGTAYSVSGGNVSGQVANSLMAGTVYTNAQPNITSVGTLTSLSVSGNVTAGIINSTIATGTPPLQVLSTTLVPNLFVASANIANFANSAGNIPNTSVTTKVIIGSNAFANGLAEPIAIGYSANSNGISAIALGATANAPGNDSLALGVNAYASGNVTIAIGYNANAGAANTIAIGRNAVATSNNAITIGGNSRITAPGSILFNATGANTTVTQGNSLFIKPIRDSTDNSAGFTVQLYYNPTTGEIGYQ